VNIKHYVTPLLIICFSLFGCTPSYYLDCTKVADIKDVSLSATYPAIGFPSELEARMLVENYLTTAVCSNTLPKESRFKPYFFEVSDLSKQYEVLQFYEGFGKQPAGILIKMENDLLLLFCFNKMVVNCNKAKECKCPYDFNREPQLR
jgi:hypothetical protein